MQKSFFGIVIAAFLNVTLAAQGPWSAPANVGPPVNGEFADFQPAISPDGLSLYIVKFCSDAPVCDPNKATMWVSHRATKAAAWGAPEQLPVTINFSGKTKATPFISDDGHSMYFASNRTPGNCGIADLSKCRNDLWVSYRNDVTADSGPDGWQAPVNLGPGVNSGAQEQMGCIFTDSTSGTTTLIFNSDRRVVGGVGNSDLYAATLQSDGTFSSVSPISELNTDFLEQHPTCSRDGLEMYFVSDRPGSIIHPLEPACGPAGAPSLDLWISTRASTSEPWRPAENLDFANADIGGGPINNQCHDGRPSLSSDGTELYFYSAFRNTGQPGGNLSDYFDIWVSTRPDTTAPQPPTAHISPAPNAAGWNNTDAIVSFTSNGDPGHISTGVAECTSDVAIVSETSGAMVDGTCTDHAGNVSAPMAVNVKLDKAAPAVQVIGVRNGETYLLGNVPGAGCNSSDGLSGLLAAATLTLSGGNAYGVGAFAAACSGAVDIAGNSAPSLTANYTVAYAFSGFLPPVGPSNEFKLGSTIPLKWQLRDASGNYINRLNAVQTLQLSYLGVCSGSTGNTVDLETTGATGLRYDASSNQFIFNWQTKGLPSGCYRITLSLDDATIHPLTVSLI